MDLLFLFRTVGRNGGNCHPGDLIELRRLTDRITQLEAKAFYVLRVNDVPAAKAAAIQAKLMEPWRDGAGDDAVYVGKRAFGLRAAGVTPAQVMNYLQNNFPAAAQNVATFFNATTAQTAQDVLSVNWTLLKTLWRHKAAGRAATAAEIGDDS